MVEAMAKGIVTEQDMAKHELRQRPGSWPLRCHWEGDVESRAADSPPDLSRVLAAVSGHHGEPIPGQGCQPPVLEDLLICPLPNRRLPPR